jgi:putative ATP-dependent endonuclease of OLD family
LFIRLLRLFRQQNDPCVFFTDQLCFEMDLVRAMLDHGRRRLLDEIIFNAGGMPGRATGDMLRKACHKLNKDRAEYPSCDLASAQPRLPDSLYVYYFAWLYSNKGVVLGRLVGASLRADEIPSAFVRVIQAAGRLAKVNNR